MSMIRFFVFNYYIRKYIFIWMWELWLFNIGNGRYRYMWIINYKNENGNRLIWFNFEMIVKRIMCFCIVLFF